MRANAVALTTLFLGLCHAQVNTAGLPACAGDCITGSFGSCGGLDAKCICTSDQVIANLACCVSVSCEKADQDTTLQFAQGICDAYDADLPSSATCAPGAQSTPVGSSTGTGAGAATTGSSSTATSGSSSTATSSSSGSGSASSSASSSAASAASQSSASASAAASTGNAAVRNERVESGLGLGLAIAGLIAVI